MTSMMATVLKVLCAFLFAGAMSAAGFMNAILEKLKTFVHSDGTLILVTVISVLIIALIVGNAYIPILMGGELFSESFKERNLAPQNLSRTLEDAGTCSIPLVPWSAGGAYMSGNAGSLYVRICPVGNLFVTQVLFLWFSGALPGLESRN